MPGVSWRCERRAESSYHEASERGRQRHQTPRRTRVIFRSEHRERGNSPGRTARKEAARLLVSPAKPAPALSAGGTQLRAIATDCPPPKRRAERPEGAGGGGLAEIRSVITTSSPRLENWRTTSPGRSGNSTLKFPHRD